MADSTPLMIRIAKSVLPRLDRAAKRIGSNRSAMVKFLIQTFLDKFERGGLGALPHDWENVMHDLDGRTLGQQQNQSLRVAENSDSPAAPLKKKQDADYSKIKTHKKPSP